MPAAADFREDRQAVEARIVARAARAAGTAAAVFTYDGGGREGACGLTCGGAAAACAHVATLPWGVQACRRSRETASTRALQRNRITPFVCHLGFACVAAPLDTSSRETVVFGPYVAGGTADPAALEREVRAGLTALPQAKGGPNEDAGAPLPFSLADIPLRSADSVVAVAEWCAEDLRNARAPERECDADVVTTSLSSENKARGPRRRTPAGPHDHYQGSGIAAAVAAGDGGRLRSLVALSLEEPVAGGGVPSVAALRARAVALVGAALEHGVALGLDVERAWDRWGAFVETAANATTTRALADAVTNLLRSTRPRTTANHCEPNVSEVNSTLGGLDRWLAARWPEPVTLESAAAGLGLNPSTLTKRLQRSLGLSFTQYVNRRRVDHAKDLLARTQLPVGAIAKRVGIEDAANLTRLFRRHEGATPTQYRRRHGAAK